MHIARCTIHNADWMLLLHIADFVINNAHFTINVYCWLHTAHCLWHNVYCLLYKTICLLHNTYCRSNHAYCWLRDVLCWFHDVFCWLNSELFYSFDPPIELKPGDNIETVCGFNTMSRNQITYRGEATSVSVKLIKRNKPLHSFYK